MGLKWQNLLVKYTTLKYDYLLHNLDIKFVSSHLAIFTPTKLLVSTSS